ncbi:MAG: hypothetical protein MRZ79_25405 [Bacteroidia bacterium]|nr:hypothetical protein [Bacteroidia bacterium]
MPFLSRISIFILILFIFGACSQQNQPSPENKLGVFMGMTPTQTPRLLAPTLIASSLDEYNGSFSPDGKEFFFTTNAPNKAYISYTRMNKDGSWTEPKLAPFSGTHSEYDPLFSPDGQRVYFSSERPTSDSAEGGKTNIWYVEKGSNWKNPVHIPLTGKGDYHSSVTKDGKIYFNVWETGDLYVASPSDSGYQVERLPSILNTSSGEGDPFISPDEDYLIYRGYNKSLGRGDFYISFKEGENWTEPQNLGKPFNSERHEMCPNISPDGKFFIFSSSRQLVPYDSITNLSLKNIRLKHQSPDNGQLNNYYISADFLKNLRP